MSRVFTRLLVRHLGQTGDELLQTIPADNYTYVVRNISMTNFGDLAATMTLYLTSLASGSFWLAKADVNPSEMVHLEIRHVALGGDQLRLSTDSPLWVVYVTGYVLGPD